MDVPLVHKRLRGLALKRAGFALCVRGPAGIGKTHAVRELLQSAPCASSSLHASTSASALLHILPRPRALPAWAQAITAKLERGEFVEDAALLDVIQATLSLNAPFILHLEDIHEVSPDRLEWLGKLADAVKRTRGVALIVTSRQMPPESFEAVQLEPLTEEETRALLEGEVGAPLPIEALSWIYSRAAGNPLFSLEFFRHLARQGFAWNDARRWHWRTPPNDTLPITVEALIEQTLDATSDVQDALAAKALLPAECDDALWARVCCLSPQDLQGVRMQLERHGVFKRNDFAHPLYREVVNRRLLPGKRQALARRALEMLSASNPDQAAEFVEAASLSADEAVAQFKAAAAHCLAIGDLGRAGAMLARAVEHLTGIERARLAREAAVMVATRNRSLGQRLLEIAVGTDPNDVGAIYLLARSMAETGRWADVERTLELLPEAERASGRWTAELIHQRFGLRDFTGVLELVTDQFLPVALSDPLLAYKIGFSKMMRGDQVGAEQIAMNTLQMPELSAEVRSKLLTVSAFSWMYRMEFGKAEPLFDAAVAAASEDTQKSFIAAALHNRSILYENLSRASESQRDSVTALNIYRETGEVLRYASTLTKIGRFSHEFGDYEQAESSLLEARDLLGLVDASDYLMTCEGHLSALYYDWATPQSGLLSLKYAQNLRQKATERKSPKYIGALYRLALVLTRQGQTQQALALAHEAQMWSEEFGGQALYQAQWALGMVLEADGQLTDALEALKTAVSAAKESDWDVYAQKIALELDRMTGDLESARVRLAWFEARGLLNGATMAKRYFPQLGASASDLNEREDAPVVRIEVLGAMQIGGVAVRGRKRQELLAALLEARIAGRAEVTRLELLDALYPDEDEDRAGSSLKELVRSTRASLGAGSIQTTASGYAMGTGVTSDAEAFLETGNTSLWRGAYLGGLGSSDDAVRESLHLALALQAEQHLESDPKEAARLGRLLLEFEPYNQNFLYLTLSALRASDNRKASQRFYSEARDRLSEVGEALPERWQDFLLETATA